MSDTTRLRVMPRDQWFGVLPDDWSRLGGFKLKEVEDFCTTLDRAELLRLALGACAERDGDLLLVAAVGEINAGKSSLINAIAGRKIQSVAFTRCTIFIHLISHTSNDATLEPLCDGLFGHHPRLYPRVEKNLTDESLKNIVVIDTPGFGEANKPDQDNEWRDEFIREFLPVCDVVLFVMQPRSPTMLEMQVIPRWAEELPGMPAVFVTTHRDQVPADELPATMVTQRADIRSAVVAKLQQRDPQTLDSALRAMDSASYVWVTVKDPTRPEHLDEVVRVLERHKRVSSQPNGQGAKVDYFRRRCAAMWDRVGQFVAARWDEIGKLLAEVERRMASAKDVHRQLSMVNLCEHWAKWRAEVEKLIHAAKSSLGKVGSAPASDGNTPLDGWGTGMDNATAAAVSEIVAGIRRWADTGLRQLYDEVGREAAEGVRAAKPADVTVRTMTDDEVAAALGITAHAAIDLWYTPRMGAQADGLPTACKLAVADVASYGRRVADQLQQMNAALTEGEVGKIVETVRSFTWEKVRTDLTAFMKMYRDLITVYSPQGSEYHDWPHLAARWQEVNRPRTPAEWDTVSAEVVGDLLPPVRATEAVDALAARRRRVQQTVADTRIRLDGHTDHLTRFDALYAQEVSGLRTQAVTDTRRLMDGMIPSQGKKARDTLASMRDRAKKLVQNELRSVDVVFALHWGAIIGLGVVALLLGVFYLMSVYKPNSSAELWKIILGMVSGAAGWVFKEKVLNRYSRENYSPHGGYSEAVINKCRKIIREAFTPTGNLGDSVANEIETQVRRQLVDQRQRLFKSAVVGEYQRAYAECLTQYRTLAECHKQQVTDLQKMQHEFHGLLTFATDPTETLGVHMNRLVADSVQLVKDIADDWAGTSQEFDVLLRRWSPMPKTKL
ncbi:MAG: GTPase [Fimbriiglobus sp.]